MADPIKLLRAIANTSVNIPFPGANLANERIYQAPNFFDFDEIAIPVPTVYAPEGNPVYFPLTLGGVRLQGEPNISVTFNKQVVKNIAVGGLNENRKGSVKEMMGWDDASITIRGYLFNDDDLSFPNDLAAQLYEIYELNRRVSIRHEILNEAGITGVVIESMSWPEDYIQNRLTYEIRCISDEEEQFKFISDGFIAV